MDTAGSSELSPVTIAGSFDGSCFIAPRTLRHAASMGWGFATALCAPLGAVAGIQPYPIIIMLVY